MSYEHGSQQLPIQNPFRLDGLLVIVSGLVSLPLGIILLFQVKELVVLHHRLDAWIGLGSSLFLLLFGLRALGVGLFKIFRFYVGRGAPADLAVSGSQQGLPHYSSSVLAEMLMGRKNLTFSEPNGWVARLLHSLLYGLITMPMPIRNVTLKLFEGVLYTVVVLVCYGLAVFSASTGLVQLRSPHLDAWLAWIATVAILAIWTRRRPGKKDLQTDGLIASGAKGVAIVVALSVTAPVILFTVGATRHMPAPTVSPYPWLIAVSVLGATAFAVAIFLVVQRIRLTHPLTEVEEYRDHWLESVHPLDIFRAFEMIMADQRHIEIPNRVYARFDADLIRQGGDDKGSFKGTALEETQPIPVELEKPAGLKFGRLFSAISGQLLAIVAVVWLYMSAHDLAHERITGAILFDGYFPPMVFLVFSAIMAWTARLYWSEIHFDSSLVHFFAEGTYSESKISTGMGVYDSNRSENVVVRSSLTPWVLASRIRSSTFATSGQSNLAHRRYILEMRKGSGLVGRLVEGMQNYVKKRQIIAGVSSQEDLQAADNFHQMNELTRASMPPTAVIEAAARHEQQIEDNG